MRADRFSNAPIDATDDGRASTFDYDRLCFDCGAEVEHTCSTCGSCFPCCVCPSTRAKFADPVLNRVDEEFSHLEYADNYRAYRVGDEEGRARFEAQAERGCCGSVTATVKIDGVWWIIGCNYGH